MLKLASKKTYKRIVPVEVPLDMGIIEKSTFVVELKRLSVTETKELISDAQDKTLSDEEMMNTYCMGWEGLYDDDGKELAYTPSNLELVLDIPYIRKALMNAFIEDVFGKEAVRKN